MPVSVLLVDDDAESRLLARLWIEDHPHDIEIVGEASGAEEAVQLAKRLEPDVVLLDARMPPTDGFATGALIHSARPLQRLVMYSGLVDADLRRRALSAGFSDCVQKDDLGRVAEAIVTAAE